MSVIGIEFERVGKIYKIDIGNKLKLNKGDFVLVETKRGKELGKVVSFEDVNLDNGKNKSTANGLRFIRVADNRDIKKYESLKQKGNSLKQQIQRMAYKLNLDIKIMNVAYTIDGGKLLIDFASEKRVDFREFVKKLAGEFRVKIELLQIGSRDETKRLGGIGPCGRPCCCSCHLRDFDKVSIKMAKNQNISLNPNKINGLCGKLMCCLAYENETYQKMIKTMPKVGSLVKTADGEGVVMFNDILGQKSTIKIESSNEYKIYNIEDIQF